MVLLARESRYFVRSVASAAVKRRFCGFPEGPFSMASYRIFRRSKGTLGLCRAVRLRAVCLVRMVHRSTFSFHDRIDALPPMPAIPLAIGSSDILVVAFLDSSLDIPPRGWARFAIWGFALALDSARARADWTSVPHFGHECVFARTMRPFLTRNCLPQCPVHVRFHF